MGLGDAVAVPAQIVAKGVDYVFDTDLQNCASCTERKSWLNNFGNKIYDLFWSTKKGDKMADTQEEQPQEQELIDFQIVAAVKAEGVEDALTKRATWKVMAITPRPIVQFGPGIQPGTQPPVKPAGQVIVSGPQKT